MVHVAQPGCEAEVPDVVGQCIPVVEKGGKACEDFPSRREVRAAREHDVEEGLVAKEAAAVRLPRAGYGGDDESEGSLLKEMSRKAHGQMWNGLGVRRGSEVSI